MQKLVTRNARPFFSALLVLILVPVLLALPETSSSDAVPLGVAALLIQAVVLMTSRHLPGPAVAAVALIDSALFIVSPGDGSGSVGTVLAVYGTRRDLNRGRAFAWLAPLAAMSVVAAVIAGPDAGIESVWTVPFAVARAVLLFGTPALLAELAENRIQIIEVLRQRAELAEREQTATARHAVQQHRTQLARELHDIAAHHLTGIIVGAQAASALAERDPPAQRRYLAALQEDAREALDHLRLTVGLLRSDGADHVLPAPVLEDIPRVVQEAVDRGTAVDFSTSGKPGTIGPVAGVVAVRGLQEALANTRKHAPHAPVTVMTTWTGDELRIAVENDATDTHPLVVPSSGYGLTGLRERLMLVGGTLDSGRTPGGWRTTFTLPATPATVEKEDQP